MLKNTFLEKIPRSILVFVIVVSALIPRIWQLTTYPPVIVDEPANLRDIYQMFESGTVNPLAFHWDFSKSQLVHVPALVTISLVGQQNQFLGLRLASVFLSILALIAFFFSITKLTNQTTGFVTTILFSYNYYFLQFSRVGWTDVIFNIAAGLWLFYLLSLFIKTKRKWALFFGGVLAGLLAYSYRSGLIYIAVSFVYLTVELLFYRYSRKALLSSLLFYFLIFFFVSAPWFYTAFKNQDKYMLRSNVVSIQNALLPYQGLTERKDIMKYQIATSLRSWIFLEGKDGGGNENQRYIPKGMSPVNIVTKIGFWIGFLIALATIRRTYPFFLIFALGIWFGQVQTVYPPNGSRGLILLPVIYTFFALTIAKIFQKFPSSIIVYSIIILTILIALSDFQFYQWWMGWIEV